MSGAPRLYHALTGHFDAVDLRPEASLNRTCIAALPGAEARWIGQPAFDLLSAEALATLTVERDATAVTDEFGRRLAHLLATLLLAPPAPLAFAPVSEEPGPWRRAYLAYWRTIEEVWLGGGLAAALGEPLSTATRRELQRLGVSGTTVELAPHAAELPLIGAARSSRASSGSVAVLDFGHTAIKRGIATLEDGRLERLTTLPPWPAPEAEHVLKTVVEAISSTVQAGHVDRTVWISLASYLQAGWPADTRGLYTPLNTLARTDLEAQLSARAGTSLEVRLLHDGTAAARALRTDHRAAVVMLGTALGVGFCPSPARAASTLLDLAPNFDVAAARNAPGAPT